MTRQRPWPARLLAPTGPWLRDIRERGRSHVLRVRGLSTAGTAQVLLQLGRRELIPDPLSGDALEHWQRRRREFGVPDLDSSVGNGDDALAVRAELGVGDAAAVRDLDHGQRPAGASVKYRCGAIRARDHDLAAVTAERRAVG